MLSASQFLTFWGKAQPAPGAAAAWHPVAYHLLDVAAVADRLLTVRRRSLERGARLLGVAPEDARRLLVTLAGLHDLGKFTPAFQAKYAGYQSPLLRAMPTRMYGLSRHTDDGYVLWQGPLNSRLVESCWPNGAGTIRWLVPGVFGHHGSPVTANPPADALERRFVGMTENAAIDCADAVIALLSGDPLAAPDATDRRAAAASWWCAGLVTTADWIGSCQRWFPYSPPDYQDETLVGYWQLACERAERAVAEAGLVPPAVSAVVSFVQSTGRAEAPTPAQEWAGQTVLPDGPVLIILEDVTGAGKTEAAQLLVHRLMASGRASGAYWAMPTQATANAMYARQAGAISRLFESAPPRPSLVLAHGQARLDDRFQSSVLRHVGEALAGEEEAHDADLPGTASCSAFLADDSRAGLLADVGAGTIDQALLGVLPSKFNTMRLFGLADKVLVIDEAHAYDAFTGTQMQQLLAFHGALGGSAIVLSATLSGGQRTKLVAAWRRGVDGADISRFRRSAAPSASESRSTGYPLATVAGENGGFTETALEAAHWSRRRVPVRFVRTVDEVVDHILRAVALRARVAWIRNTVDDCLEGAERLRSAIDPLVFHARFAQCDRQRREAEVLRAFGAGGSGEGALVATQVIEQSLDLDFDVMVSDIAPVDLLVQRAGRLWRHEARNAHRPSGLVCELVVLAPETAETPPVGWLGGEFRRTARVYQNPGLLWRTIRALGTAKEIRTPEGLRPLIESVYGDDTTPSSLSPAADRAIGKQTGDTLAATYATLSVEDGYNASQHHWENELRARTRLEDVPTHVIRLARRGATGIEPWAGDGVPEWKRWALSELRLAHYLVPPGATPTATVAAAVDTARSAWGRYEQDIPVLVLEPSESEQWEGGFVLPDGDMRRFRYSLATGLDRIAQEMAHISTGQRADAL